MRVPPPAARLGRHGLALAVVLLALLPLVGSDAVWSADVGAQLHQSAHLLNGSGWTSSHPLPELDPEGHYYGLHLAQRPVLADGDPHRYVTLAKHPFLTWTVAGLISIGGFTAVLIVSALGTVAAAVGAGRITEMFRPDLGPWSLWITGLLSPLFFDAYIGYAHTVAAAAVTWACYFALRTLYGSPFTWTLMAAVGLTALACLVRTEGALAAVALAVAVASLTIGQSLTGQTPQINTRRAWLASLWLVVGGVAAVVADRFMALGVSGPANPAWRPETPSFAVGRWLGFTQTWLNPGRAPADLLLVVAAVALLTVVAAASRATASDLATDENSSSSRQIALVVGGVVALAAIAARALAPDPVMVSGLLFAFPLLPAGFLAVRRVHLDRGPIQVCLVAFSLYALAVVATQYSYGGVAEWGGRYFAAGLPLGVVAIMTPLADAAERIPRRTRAAVLPLFALASLSLNALGIASLHNVRQSTAELVQEIESATTELSTDQDTTPIVVSTVPLAGRVSWSIFDQSRWLLIESDQLAKVALDLRRLNVDEFTLVTFSPDSDTQMVSQVFKPDRSGIAPDDQQQPNERSVLVRGDAVVVMRASDAGSR